MDWILNMRDVLEYIEDNLSSQIDLDIISQKACCSIYNFQRIFSYISGVSLAEYIRRRRMTNAAFDIQKSNDKISDIGFKYGYESAAFFSRAFQSVHGVSPIKARDNGIILNLYPKISLSLNIIGGEVMKYRIEEKSELRILGVRTKLYEEHEKNMEIVPQFWEETLKSPVFQQLLSLESTEPKGILGITVYHNPEEIYYYIGVSTDEIIKDGLMELTIPNAKWVVFENEGYFPESIQTIFKRFLTEWLPFSGYEWDEKPDIEVYPVTNSKMVGGHSEVWISITNKKRS